MTLHLNSASAQAIEHTYKPLANALQSRLDALSFRVGAVLGVLTHEVDTTDHGTGTIPSEEQEVLREHARQLILEAEALAEAIWEVTGEIGQLPLSDARLLERAPRHRAALEELGMLDAFGGASAMVDATVDVDQLPPPPLDDVVDAEVVDEDQGDMLERRWHEETGSRDPQGPPVGWRPRPRREEP